MCLYSKMILKKNKNKNLIGSVLKMGFVNFCRKNILMRKMYHADNVTDEVIQCNKLDSSLLQTG